MDASSSSFLYVVAIYLILSAASVNFFPEFDELF